MGKNVAVFVDVANIFYAAKAAGVDIDYVTLLKAASAGRDLVRAYAYTGLDPDNENQRNFHDFLRRSNYKVVSKDIRKYGDGKVKANLDIELVVDMMKTARNLDIAIVVSGDGDFAPAIRAVQEQGVRVEVISFRGNTSSDLIEVADQFTDIIQLARVEKGTRSGRRVADDDADLSMTEVPDKQTEGTGVGRGRAAVAAVAVARPSPSAAAASSSRGRGRPSAAPVAAVAATARLRVPLALPGERLRQGAVGLTEAELAARRGVHASTTSTRRRRPTRRDHERRPGRAEDREIEATAKAKPRRRRRRGGRGRGRGRGRRTAGGHRGRGRPPRPERRPPPAARAPAPAHRAIEDEDEDETAARRAARPAGDAVRVRLGFADRHAPTPSTANRERRSPTTRTSTSRRSPSTSSPSSVAARRAWRPGWRRPRPRGGGRPTSRRWIASDTAGRRGWWHQPLPGRQRPYRLGRQGGRRRAARVAVAARRATTGRTAGRAMTGPAMTGRASAGSAALVERAVERGPARARGDASSPGRPEADRAGRGARGCGHRRTAPAAASKRPATTRKADDRGRPRTPAAAPAERPPRTPRPRGRAKRRTTRKSTATADAEASPAAARAEAPDDRARPHEPTSRRPRPRARPMPRPRRRPAEAPDDRARPRRSDDRPASAEAEPA